MIGAERSSASFFTPPPTPVPHDVVCAQHTNNLLSNVSRLGYTPPAEENVTFSNNRNVSNMHASINHNGTDREMSVSFSRCDDSDIRYNKNITLSGESNVTIEIDTVAMFYGHDILVTMNCNCNERLKRFYIPNMNVTG